MVPARYGPSSKVCGFIKKVKVSVHHAMKTYGAPPFLTSALASLPDRFYSSIGLFFIFIYCRIDGKIPSINHDTQQGANKKEFRVSAFCVFAVLLAVEMWLWWHEM